MILLDPAQSVVAQVLKHYSPAFYALLECTQQWETQQEARTRYLWAELQKGTWPNAKDEVLGHLMFHLLLHDRPRGNSLPFVRKSFAVMTPNEWGLGPEPVNSGTDARQVLHSTWYEPYRHDIIGNTVSADLLDYLLRDMAGLGITRRVDLSFLDHYVLRRDEADGKLYCVLDLYDHKRGTVRSNTFDDALRLLDLRYEIHQKAVMHRVVQSGVAMISRAAFFQSTGDRNLSSLYQIGVDRATTLASDSGFLGALCAREAKSSQARDSVAIARKLSERRVYRPLMVIPGDRIADALEVDGRDTDATEGLLRFLAASLDSRFFAPFLQVLGWGVENYLAHSFQTFEDLLGRLDVLREESEKKILQDIAERQCRRVIVWAPPYKQLYKDPEFRFVLSPHGKVWNLEEVARSYRDKTPLAPPSFFGQRADAALREAETRYMGLWKLFIFISDGLFYTGALAKLVGSHECEKNCEAHAIHLEKVQVLYVAALRAIWRHVQDRGLLRNPEKLESTCIGIKELLEAFATTSRSLPCSCMTEPLGRPFQCTGRWAEPIGALPEMFFEPHHR